LDNAKCKYHSFDTFPAKVFFDIQDSGDYQLMKPKPKTDPKWLAAIFADISNEVFIRRANKESEEYLALVSTERYYIETIPFFDRSIQYAWNFPTNVWHIPEVRALWTAFVESLNVHLDPPIDVNGQIAEEISQALNVSIGIMKNDLAEAQMALEDIRRRYKDVEKTDFYDQIQNINEWNAPQHIAVDCMLGEFLAAEKSMVKKQDRQRIKEMTNGGK